MPIKDIDIIVNKEIPTQAPIKERMDIFIPDKPTGLPRRNGFISVYS